MVHHPNIVSPNEVMDENAIRAIRPIINSFFFANTLDSIRWCAKHRLLANSRECEGCHRPMGFCQRALLGDGYYWNCSSCRKRVSLRNGSFFSDSGLPLSSLLVVMYSWSWQDNHTRAKHEARLGPKATHTIVDWYNFCRDVCGADIDTNTTVIGGFDDLGQPKVVEIDEGKFLDETYHRGHWTEGHWVFGGIERDSGKCFLVEAPDRKRETLIALIRRFILPGSIIMSYGWAAYARINEIDDGIYDHQVVMYEPNFVDPVHEDVHIRTMVALWRRVKKKIRRQHRTSSELFSSYLREILWRSMVGDGNPAVFGNFIAAVNRRHPVFSRDAMAYRPE